jgi:protoporphyrinogen/coproporphyrinogen III oxidase
MPKQLADAEYDIAIVGGGFAGLALAFRLSQQRQHRRVVLLEATPRLGGKALTEIIETEQGRFLIEAGPDSFLAAKPWTKQQAVELGLEDRLIPINSIARPVSILKNGELIRMPAGLNLAAPSLLKPFVASPLLSPSGRARVLREPRIRALQSDDDESVGDFIHRRLGPEMLDWIAEPLMAGIYNGDPDEMSLLATFPQLRAQERDQGGLIRSARLLRRMRVSGARPAAFLTFRDGMQELTAALVDRIGPIARTGAHVQVINRRPADTTYQIVLANGEHLRAENLVMAVSANAAAEALRTAVPDLASHLDRFRTNPAGSISLAFPNESIARPLPGYGLLVPMKERRPINAVTVASKKFDHRAPAGWTVLRVFFGGARSPETMTLSDADLTKMVLLQLQELLGIQSAPLIVRITRWPSGSPQYDVGHLDRIAELGSLLPPNLHLTGSSYRGVGLPDLAHEAELLAAKLTH